MSFLDELDGLADQVKDDVQELRNRAVKWLDPSGQLVKDGPFPQSLVLTFEGS